jgi:Uma2 family endonuclease
MALLVERARRLFTIEEYHRMAETGILRSEDRVELINGEILEMSPIDSRHASCVNNLNRALVLGLGTRAVVSPQNPVQIPLYSEPEPDLAVLRPRFYETSAPTTEDVLLLVEVAETSLGFDRTVKLALYARAGIREYWLADAATETVAVCRQPAGETYEDVRVVGIDGTLSPLAFPDLLIRVAELFA